jgi:diguanylate cyclase (GGDEF)-like protein
MIEVLGADDYARSLPWIERALRGEPAKYEKSYYDESHLGSVRHASVAYVPLTLEDGEVDGFVSVSHDVTQHKLEESRLQQLSQRDKLTGLLNRAGLERYMEDALRDTPLQQANLALLYIDLDHFKPVNDLHGHATGDELLKLFALRLSRTVRPTDAVVRLGGDEFLVVLSGVRDHAGACLVAEKVVVAGEQPFDIRGLQLRVGASVGFALGSDETEGFAGLLKRADEMLYAAKNAGRGRFLGGGPSARSGLSAR